MKRLLLVSNDTILCKLFERYCKQNAIQTSISTDLEKAIQFVKEGKCDAIVVNIPLLTECLSKKSFRIYKP